jgi:hypothetical protein
MEMGSMVGEWEKQCGGAVIVVLVCVWVYFFVVEDSICVRDCRGFGVCQVGIVGCSVGDYCEGGRDSLVTGWGRMRGEGEGWLKTMGERETE